MVGALSSYTRQGISTQIYAARTAVDAGSGKADSTQVSSSKSNRVVTDKVEISAEALELTQAQKPTTVSIDPRVTYYQQFRPTHEGFSSYNMTLGIVDPGAEPFSQSRSFGDVAQAARENLNTNYQKLEDIGKPYNSNTRRSEDQNSLFGELDRRALYAVTINEAGLFSKDEQEQARSIMGDQQGMAMGLYNGPTALAGKFAPLHLSNDDYQRIYKAGMQFLDNASTEEKSTDFMWAMQRAGVQIGYENAGGRKGEFDSTNPLVSLIREALDGAGQYEGEDNMDVANVRSADDLKTRSWFEGYIDRLDIAVADARKLYGLES